MAAYLVGTGGRLRDALALGASITVTHTSSVLVIGVLALFASRFGECRWPGWNWRGLTARAAGPCWRRPASDTRIKASVAVNVFVIDRWDL
jgi:hypothetical protein